MLDYIRKIWDTRHFWMHLVLSDLRSRWRRSFFGIFWTMLQPLGLTALISIVFSKLFNTDILLYAPYILSGIIVWEFYTACFVGGAFSFVQADAYIKQFPHPLFIYPLRSVLAALVVLLLASLPLIGWTLFVLPQNFGTSWFAVIFFYPLAAMIALPLTTIFAYFSVQFRDIPLALPLLLQALWFISPVYFEVSMFRKRGLDFLVDYNPIYHILQLIRAPLLAGEWPTAANYDFCISIIFALTLCAIFVGRLREQKVIFYL